MSDLDLIRQLADRLGRPLQELPEARFERHAQARAARDWLSQELIKRDAYALAVDGTVSGLFLQRVTSEIFVDFLFAQLSHIKHLHLSQVNLSDYSGLAALNRLTSLYLSDNQITDVSSLAVLNGLTTLYLSNNQITDVSGLAALNGLASLYLSNNQISDVSSLAALNGLTTLDLSNNPTIDVSGLAALNGLTSLYLSNNQITDVSSLAALNGLTTLDLSNNQISDVSGLAALNRLTSLDLRNNQISDVSGLAALNRLTSLDLRNNPTIDVSGLAALNGLTTLYLSNNPTIDVSGLAALNGLTTLYLSDNQISDVSDLAVLNGLTTLYLSNNQISDVSDLAALNGLTSLYLSNNQVSDVSDLAALKGLTTLSLSDNQTSDVSGLAALQGLTSLYLSDNQITDVSGLAALNGLTTLDLSNNQISDVSGLAALNRLTSLDLRNNQISDVSGLAALQGLTSLYLSYNQITDVPGWLANGRLAIEVEHEYASNCINLTNNPITEPPLEIVRQGNAAILSYYEQLAAQGQDRLYEAKMLIIGEGEAGKTTLAHKISAPNCPLPHVDDRTRGISIQTHSFACRDQHPAENSEDRTFHLNIWDFGGQEIYHYTHRFFLSKRSLYVLVADNRKDDTDFNYWLNIIELFAGNSPLIIVLNEKGDVQRGLNQADLRGRYANSIKDIIAVNFKTHEEPDAAKVQERLRRIHTLIGAIEHCAQTLTHIGEAVPARWVDVRQAIEADKRDYIYRHQFDEICQAQGITASQDIDTLLGYFHDLGILLHFADNPLLRDRVILNPTWATNAVYRIFDDDDIKAKAGRFSRQDCAAIWCDPGYRHLQDVLIELMKNFRLVYEIGATGNLVAPQLLPPNTPSYPWDDSHNSHMQFRYDAFMPKGIFWQFAIALYRYIPNHDWVWRNGMVIRRGNTWAEVTEDLNQRRISLRFAGPSIAEFRAVIVDEFDSISQSYHQLRYDKMIPCRCSECVDHDQPHFFAFTDLKKRQEQRKKTTIECVKSGEDISLSHLLEGYEVQAILSRLPDKKDGDPAPPGFSQSNSSSSSEARLKTIKIFLASSSELKEDREQFEIFISRQNDHYINRGIRLELVIWEKFPNAMSKTRSQDEYNKAISSCDVFVGLFYTKVGQYTNEEFLVAVETFKDSNRPLILTYFKNAPINTGDITAEIMTLINFKKKLSDIGHFYQPYADSNDLKHQFGEQLVKFLPQ